MVDIAHEDAETFVIFQQEDVPDDFQIDPNDCMTPQIEHLYDNIARLAELRCLVDAAIMAALPDASVRALGAAFDDRGLKDAGDRYPSFAMEKKASYH